MSKQEPITPATDAIGKLVQEFSKLPGIGPKSAQRIVFYLLRSTEDKTSTLAEALASLKQRVNLCSVCCNVTESDPCPICRNSQRDTTLVCIVEQPQDILALEHTGAYKGLYHVLHGAISPTEGIGADNIRIRELLDRFQNGTVKEVILATNTNMEGEQTAMYLSRVIAPLNI
ncbi:MAG: recombination mediator RecR, partial [Dehalococcoidales bacterium]|nr:recombination mediator RecR [Dehalococcoidales bacterium]